MSDDTERQALAHLRTALGPGAQFRDGQLEAIHALVDDGSRVLVVERTGWGKSVVYFVATRLLRSHGAGPTILISPLLSLIRDQLKMANRFGLVADHIDMTNPDKWGLIDARLADDQIDLLLIGPERLANERFRTTTVPAIRRGIGLLVVDEAHCISDWGHDFRPDYRRIRRVVNELPNGVPVLATTATANDRVQDDIVAQLGEDLLVIRGPLARESLHLQVVALPDQAERLAWLATYLDGMTGSGIVYTLTVRDADKVSAWLASQGICAPAYHAHVADDERVRLEHALLANDMTCLVATVALGMGFDKPDLAFVVHYQRPGSAILYYQQVGRAGRALDRAEAILLAGDEDDAIVGYFIDSAFPPEEELRDVLSEVEEHDEVSVPELTAVLNLSKGALERALRFLEIEGAVAKTGGRYARTPNPWVPENGRSAQVTAVREHELERMREYVRTGACRMAFLTGELDDPVRPCCGRCSACAGPFAPEGASAGRVHQARVFLRRAYRPITPRKRWPSGIDGEHGAISAEEQLREGRALSVYGDAGWGSLVKDGKYGGDRFDNELVQAVIEMLASWQPGPEPTWVTAVPSRRAPSLVPDFARRLAAAASLEYRDALIKIEDTQPQKDMQNSAHQAANVIGAFAAVPDQVLAGPVLLVDDMVDSRWSLTVCGVRLARAGSGPVFPVALAETGSGSD